jgi:hypothetical protein
MMARADWSGDVIRWAACQRRLKSEQLSAVEN